MSHYILEGKTPRLADPMEWAKWFGTTDRHIGNDVIGGVRISTVFLGVDHKWEDGPPLLFETMIFGGPHGEYQTRSSTWDEAEQQHAVAVALVKSTAAHKTAQETT